MKNNIYVKYLLEHLWIEKNQILFFHPKNSIIEFFFDTSNQVEIYNNHNRVYSKYLNNLDDLISILESIDVNFINEK